MPRVMRTIQADLDLFEVWEYIARDNESAANTLLYRIEQACLDLAGTPRSGTDRSQLLPDVRSVPIGNYVLFYRPIDDGIQLLRVLHGARDLDELLGES